MSSSGNQEPPRPPPPPPPPPLPPTSIIGPDRIGPLHDGGNDCPSQSEPRSSVPASERDEFRGHELVVAGPSRPVIGDLDEFSQRDAILEASTALANCLQDRFKWAAVGGAALIALGSRRVTEDIDIVIAPPNRLREAKSALRNDPRFTIEPRTRYTTFASSILSDPIQIDFLSFPATFKGRFEESTGVTMTSSGLKVLQLPFLLESKCDAISERSSEAKRESDAADIMFLLNLMVQYEVRTTLATVPSASAEFQEWFESNFLESAEAFAQVGL
ncbi:MAG: Aromatic/aminoadipate aminotransferase 1 [Chaenotheca gracillima]|nr:MAG: Aromatic/aminoadipate aminotransferase 1 [Chaenotheca gracillima]